MEKRRGYIGVNKRLLKKPKTTKKSLLNKVVEYLKSDFYMFAPLVEYPPFDVSGTSKVSATSYTGIAKAVRPSSGKEKILRNKVEEYLKSDLYMYAPLLDRCSSTIGSATIPPEKGVVSVPVLSTETLKDIEQPLKDLDKPSFSPGEILKNTRPKSKAPFTKSAIVRQIIAGKEAVKYVVHQNNRSSPGPGNRIRETRQKRRVK